MKQKLSHEIEAYYKDLGPDAWFNDEVPFEISSNLFLANMYADLVIAYLEDCRFESQTQQPEQIYLLEIGAAFGQFAFYFIKSMEQKMAIFGWPLETIKYIVTDLVEDNIQYIRKQAIFEPYIRRGIVDFAIYNANSDEPVHLLISDTTLSTVTKGKPFIVLGNYILDSIDTHAFKIADKKLHSIYIDWENAAKKRTDDQSFQYVAKPCPNNIAYPEHPEIQAIVDEYVEEFDNASFLIPVGGLNIIRNLRAQTQAKHFVLLAGDKGYVHSEEFEEDDADPHVSSHSTVSFMVNFDAIRRVFDKFPGCSLLDNAIENYSFNVTWFADQPAQALPRTRKCYQESVGRLGISDVYNFFYDDENNAFLPEMVDDIEKILTVLNILHWDPNTFTQLSDELIDVLDEDIDTCQHNTLLNCMKKVEQFFYHHDNSQDLYYELARVYYHAQEHDESIRLYEESLKAFGHSEDTLYGLGANYFSLDAYDKARDYAEQALAVNPDCELARELLEDLSEVDQEIEKVSR